MNRTDLDKAFSPTPEPFSLGVRQILRCLPKKKKNMRRFTFQTGLVCALILALLCGAALAAINGGVFDMAMYNMPPEYLEVQESAYDLVQNDLGASIEGERFLIKAEEALYDGQELRVVVSVTDKTGQLDHATALENDGDEYSWLTEAFFDALHEDGFAVHDGLEINGEYINPYETSHAAGNDPHQVLLYTRCNPYLDGVDPQGTFEVTVCFYPYDVKDEAARAEKSLTFTLDADAALDYVLVGQAEPITLESGATISLEWSKFSPLLGFVTLRIDKDGLNEETFWETLESDEAITPWLMDMTVSLPDGTKLPTMMEGYGSPDLDTYTSAQASYRIIPPAEWPDTLTFTAGDGTDVMTVSLGK